ncbi:hypothetical protein Pcal_0851 [Pyrobaculum calidifontis JCM 11548]|uniref:Uncharacterized protein n=2 Tax=Pyrobaculum calidifontis TaxID=181486 RepID=A3MUG0_PYRCJ|nr:hypothetical protein Pcal_0851 [Pyrobaculum calidifontis JCM 11548]
MCRCMDVISLQIIETLAEAELYKGGASPYYVMKKLNLYPAFSYKLIKKLEKENYIICKKNKKGRICNLTLYGIVTLFKEYNKNLARLLFVKKLNLKLLEIDSADRVLEKLASLDGNNGYIYLIIGFCLLNFYDNDIRKLLVELLKDIDFMMIIGGKCVYMHKNGARYCFCTTSLYDGECKKEKCPFNVNLPLKILKEIFSR